jgi:uncharacterized protein
MADNIATVQEIYAAFGKGDVPGIISRLSKDVEWEWGAIDQGIPWLKPRKGSVEVGKFFGALHEHVELTRFEPFSFMANEEFVMVLIRAGGRHKKSGKTWEETEAHAWGFDKQGKVNRFRHYVDTIQHKSILP